MDDRSFADRLVTYADALVAVSFVGSSGLSLALTDPESRCSLVTTAGAVSIGNLIFAGIVSVLLITLRRWELDLRTGTSASKKSTTYSRRLHVARLVVIWFSAIATVVFLLAANRDPTCDA